MAGYEPITGSVAKIVNDTELIINRGSEHGVEEGMFFRVLDASSVDIDDPESNETAGSVRTVKVAVEVVEVAPKLSLARTFRNVTVNVGGSSPDLSTLIGFGRPSKFVQQVEKIESSSVDRIGMGTAKSSVAVGDKVQQAEDRQDALRNVIFAL